MPKFEATVTSLYSKLSTHMRGQILNGELKPGDKLPSERQLSDETKLSRVTVNKAISALVDEGLLYRKRGLGTFVADPGSVIGQARRIRTENVGVISSRGAFFSGEPFYSKILLGIEQEAHREDLHVLFSTVGSSEERPTSLIGALRKRKVDGIIVIGKIPLAYIEQIVVERTPFVLVDFESPRRIYPRVLIDNYQGVNLAIHHLASMAHEKIGLIGGPLDLPSLREREDAFHQALERYGCICMEGWNQPGSLSATSGYQACKAILERSEQPTAIFAANDEMAIGALKYCQEQGIQVPGDISLIGFDNIEWSDHCHPSLSTINVPKERIGWHAVKVLKDLLRQESIEYEHCIRIQTELIVRESTGPAPAAFDKDSHRPWQGAAMHKVNLGNK